MPIKVKHKKVSLSPDSGDGSMIQPSDWNADHEVENVELINSDVTYTLKADGSGSFSTIKECIDFINRCLIANDPKVTINLSEGVFNETSTIVYTNKNLDKISIVGADPYDYTYTNVSVSGSANNWTNVISIASVDTSKVKVGQYVMIYSTTTAGTNPARLWGCHQITAVSPTSITVLNRNNHTAGPSGQAGKLKVYPTVINAAANQSLFRVVACAAGKQYGFDIPFLKHVILQGNRAATPHSIGLTIATGGSCNLFAGQTKSYFMVGIVGFYDSLVLEQNSSLIAYSYTLCISDAYNKGLCCFSNSMANISNGIVVSGVRANPDGIGLYADGQAHISAGGNSAGQGAILTGNRFGSYAWAQGFIRRYSIAYDDFVTTSCSPTANTYNTNVGSFIEA